MQGSEIRNSPESLPQGIRDAMALVGFTPHYYGNLNTEDIARRLFAKARKQGILLKPLRCSECRNVAPSYRHIHGHHDSYDEPLKVRWLCTKCHAKAPRRKNIFSDGPQTP